MRMMMMMTSSSRVVKQTRYNNYKHIFLDLFGTLVYPTKPIHVQYNRIAREVGCDIQVSEINFKKAFKRNWKEYPNYGKNTSIGSTMDPQVWWMKVIEETFKDAIPIEEREQTIIRGEEFQRLSRSIYERFSTEEVYSLYPDTIEFLNYLIQERSQDFSIITNSDPRIFEALPKSLKSLLLNSTTTTIPTPSLSSSSVTSRVGNLDSTPLKGFFTSWEVGFMKPDHRIWDFAIERLKVSRSDGLIHIGDDFEEDYLGAKAAGLESIWLKRTGEEGQGRIKASVESRSGDPPRTINSLLELIGIGL